MNRAAFVATLSRRRRNVLPNLAFLLVGIWSHPARADLILGTGTGLNSFPFGATSGAGTVYQQLYSANSFSGAESIVRIGFFLGSGTNLRSGTYTLHLSTTSVAVDALNTSNFDSNLGADNTLFGTFVLGGASAPIMAFVGTPYFYDPSLGNLLVDIRISGGGVTPLDPAFFKANNGDANGVYSRSHNFGTGFAGYGLQTQFTTIPEPSTMLLTVAGLGVLLLVRRRLMA